MFIIPWNRDRSADWSHLCVLLAIAIMAAAWSTRANALSQSRVLLFDGSIIVGDIVSYRSDAVTLNTSFNRELAIDSSLIKDIEAASEDLSIATLLLKDGRKVEAAPFLVTGGLLALSDGEIIKLSDVDKLNPERWEMGQGYASQGLASVALTVARGNTDADQLDIAVNTQFDSTRDRITLRAKAERDTAIVTVPSASGDGSFERVSKPSADNWQIIGKYDYYLKDWTQHYLGVNASVEADEFTDIRLRSYIGPYYGRKLFNDSWGKLDGELGLVRVDTDFYNADDTEYYGANWNLTGESMVLGGDSRLYLTHVGILNISDDNSVILDTTVGLGFPFFFGLEAAAEFSIDYDGAAAEGKESVDQSYNLRVGYSW